jgi:hypothetical protein
MLYGLDNLQEPHSSAHIAEAREHQSDFVFGKALVGGHYHSEKAY